VISPTPTGLPIVEAARWGTNQIQTIAWSPDGGYLAAATQGKVFIFNTATWLVERTLNSPSGVQIQIAFSPNSSQLALVTDEGVVTVFDLATGETVYAWDSDDFVIYYPGLSFSTDGSLLIYRAFNTTVWRLSDGTRLYNEDNLAVSPDGSLVVQDGVLRQVEDGKALYRIEGSGACFSTDNRVLATLDSTSAGFRVLFWRVSDGNQQSILEIGDTAFHDLQFVGNNDVLMAHSNDSSVELWRINDQQQLLKFSNVHDTLSPDGSLLVVWSYNDPNVLVFDTATGNQLSSMQLETGSGFMVFSPDGSLLMAKADQAARVWESSTGRMVSSLQDEENSRYSVAAFSPAMPGADRPALLAGISDGLLKIWNASDGNLVTVLTQEPRRIYQLAFSADDKRLAFLSDYEQAGLIPLDTGVASLSYAPYVTIDHSQDEWNSGEFSTPSISPFADRVVYVGGMSYIVSDLLDGREIAKVGFNSWSSGHPLGFSSDGKIVYYLESIGEYVLFDADNGKVMKRLQLPESENYYPDHILLSTQGQFFVVIDIENTQITIWVVEPVSSRMYSIDDLTGYRVSAALSPDGKYLAVSPANTGTRIYHLSDGSLYKTLPEAIVGGYAPMAISDNNEYVALGDGKIIQIWRIADGRNAASLDVATDIYSLAFSHNGRYLASGTEDGLIQLWDLQAPASTLPTPTPEPIPQPTPSQTPDPIASLQTVMPVTVFSGTPFPQPAQAIQPGNASQLSMLGQIGFGRPQAAAWSPDGQTIALVSGSLLKFYSADPLRETGWVDSGVRVGAVA
jgi:WD40 repeat protein